MGAVVGVLFGGVLATRVDGIQAFNLTSARAQRRGCPSIDKPPWDLLFQMFHQTMGCHIDPGCAFGGPMGIMRRLVEFTDDILDYKVPADLTMKAWHCPTGMALAVNTLALLGELVSTKNDAGHTFGVVVVALNAARMRFLPLRTTVGWARPLITTNVLITLAKRRLMEILNAPAVGAPIEPFDNATVAPGFTEPLSFPEGLCVQMYHHSSSPLALLRNAVESLVAGGILGPGSLLALLLHNCSGVWQEPQDAPQSPELWYLSWLRTRFRLIGPVCGAYSELERPCHGKTADGRPLSLWTLSIESHWHLMHFRQRYVADMLQTAVSLLRNPQHKIFAVSLSEKGQRPLRGVNGAGFRLMKAVEEPQSLRPHVSSQDLLDLTYAAPSMTGHWDLEIAGRVAVSMYDMNAGMTPSWLSNVEAILPIEGLGPCPGLSNYQAYCFPLEWRPALGASDEVWLFSSQHGLGSGIRFDDAGRSIGHGSAALLRGIFQPVHSGRYEPSASTTESLGIPDCYTCHQVPVEEDFTFYLMPLDIVGGCRELFSNLFMDLLEGLHLVSYQGPHVVLVEPMIPNQVWDLSGKEETEWRHKSNEQATQFVCTIRHGSATRFSDLFDWPLLAKWLERGRGVKGTIDWEGFVERTQGRIDTVGDLAMIWPGSPGGCETVEGPLSIRYYETDFQVGRRICLQNPDPHFTKSGFHEHFMSSERLKEVFQSAIADARKEGRNWAAAGLFLYWVEGAERAKMHPMRYGLVGSHTYYPSIWHGMRFAPAILKRAATLKARLGLTNVPYLGVHWRRGEWALGFAPRRQVQGKLAQAPEFAARISRVLKKLPHIRHVFVMTNAKPEGPDARRLAAELASAADVVLFPKWALKGDRNTLKQLCIEMAVAAEAEFFMAFGDGIQQGHASMPSMLVQQMRLFGMGRSLDSMAYTFTEPQDDQLGFGIFPDV